MINQFFFFFFFLEECPFYTGVNINWFFWPKKMSKLFQKGRFITNFNKVGQNCDSQIADTRKLSFGKKTINELYNKVEKNKFGFIIFTI